MINNDSPDKRSTEEAHYKRIFFVSSPSELRMGANSSTTKVKTREKNRHHGPDVVRGPRQTAPVPDTNNHRRGSNNAIINTGGHSGDHNLQPRVRATVYTDIPKNVHHSPVAHRLQQIKDESRASAFISTTHLETISDDSDEEEFRSVPAIIRRYVVG